MKFRIVIDKESGRIVQGGYLAANKFTVAADQELIALDKWPEGIETLVAKWNGTKVIKTTKEEAQCDREWARLKKLIVRNKAKIKEILK